MSEPGRIGDLVVADAAARPDAVIAGSQLSTWPRTRLVSMCLTLLLALALALPWLGAVDPELLIVPLIVGVIVARWLFDSRAVRAHGRFSARVLLATIPPALVGVGVMAACGLVAGASVEPKRGLASAVAVCGVLAGAAALRAAEVRYWRSSRRVFVVGSSEAQGDIGREIQRHQGMELVGCAPVSDGTALAAQLGDARPTMLVLSSSAIRNEEIVAAASAFNLRGGLVRDLSSFYEQHFAKVPLGDLAPSWFLFDVSEVHRHRAYGVVKRAGDIVLSVVLLMVLAPVLALLVCVVLITNGRPVLYRQSRVGKGDVPFVLVKLRTMNVDGLAPADWASGHATRITRVGRLLRRYRLDELPQLVNVLRGDMSLVGPRPEQVPLVETLGRQIPYYATRHRVRPGLTGWAQVRNGYSGSYGGTLEKLQYDFYYIKHQSLRLDGLILLTTLRAVLRDYVE